MRVLYIFSGLTFFLLTSQGVLAQSDEEPSSRFSSGKISPFFLNETIGLSVNNDRTSRHNLFAYNQVKHEDDYVISVHREDLNQDMVYFVNSEGETEYVTYGSTSPINFNKLFTRRDSFNPYGVNSPLEALVTGVINEVINRNLRIFKRKKKR